MRLDVNEKRGFLASVEARSSFLDKIKGKQFDDEKLSRIRDMVLRGEAKEAIMDEEGVLELREGYVCPVLIILSTLFLQRLIVPDILYILVQPRCTVT